MEKFAAFLSLKFVLGAGSVCNKYYYNVDFPRGNVALKDFNAEIVDESGNAVPLYETYIYHWVILRYFAPKHIEERWLTNVLTFYIRGMEDQFGCKDCKCDLYKVTKDEYGTPLRLGYTGCLKCCYDETQCRWVDWEEATVPVKIMSFVPRKESDDSELACKNKKISFVLPNGDYVIYGAAHQHSAGFGSALYGDDGRLMCTSLPVYGDGNEAGNGLSFGIKIQQHYKSGRGDGFFLHLGRGSTLEILEYTWMLVFFWRDGKEGGYQQYLLGI
ncbi:hypothetical protein MKW94_008418 [Papaver nudicaule]|uniref:Stress up-regulated Nod 19 n=1 Tax=Papaver nudicaule TaxID=74823 RepID=A0AA41SED5_PAPNU|nr:hypothetical protein [Papaver nudicaule]